MATGKVVKLLLFVGASLLLETGADAKHRRGLGVPPDEDSEEIYGHRRGLLYFDPEVFGTKAPDTKSGGIKQQKDGVLDSPIDALLGAPNDATADKKSRLSEKVRNVSHRRFLNEVPGQDINKYLEEDEDGDDDDFLDRRKVADIKWDDDGDDDSKFNIDDSINAIRRAAFNVMISNSTNKYPRLGEKLSSQLLAEKLKELLESNKDGGLIKEFDMNGKINEKPPNSNFKQNVDKTLEKNRLKKKRLRRPVCKLDASIKRLVDDFEKSTDKGTIKVLPNRYNDYFYIPIRYYNYLVKLKARLSKAPSVKFDSRDK